MDFTFTPEQVLLRDTVRSVLTRFYTPERRAEVVADAPGWDPKVWAAFAEIGLLGLTVPIEDGGIGGGPVETMLAMEELGRTLAPEPVFDGALLPALLISRAGTPEQRARLLPGIVEGEHLFAFAHAEPGVRWPYPRLTTLAVEDGTRWTLTGRKILVPQGDRAHRLIVSAVVPTGGTALFLVDSRDPAAVPTAYRTYDGRRGADLELRGAPAELLGTSPAAGEVIGEAVIATQAALGAEAVGAMAEALRLTTEYLKTRKQFGVALRMFQTLTHRAADMYVSLELARSMSLYAAMSLADGLVDATVASRAKLRIGRSGRHIGQEAIQLHGGIGMTAEYPLGHYTARLTAIEHTLGDSSDHLRHLAGRLGEQWQAAS
ncbi:acyl-CoA dehydrogenase family protein [Nocardia mangyaensis]|uniref:acyl-CoA dehydrogenase family protein n=1 Tax=Nocardia mangyaensis TaxID=2213200 RepID=UPI002675F174|nr:acyl-CoA dehydrogenase family protein [Nocardia mangyaensis]MDO3647804.1 acyl-CoA dehydrogenase family protein [Nocardia mangyaensis]